MVELLWYARLRWIAGACITAVGAAGALLETPALAPHAPAVFLVAGGVVLAYSALLSALIARRARRGPRDPVLRGPTSLGIGLDLAALAALVAVTGGLESPAIGLFVLHMVFVSLLLPLHMSYAAAVLAVALLAAGLAVTGTLPDDPPAALFGLGWVASLVLVAYMTDHIAGGLRRQSERLRQHQRVAAQHEKMNALGRMTAGVVHEIANPLSNMDGMLQLAARRPESLSPDAANQLREQIARINAILQQMRSFAHPDQSESETVTLDEVVERALSFVRFDKRLGRVDFQPRLEAEGARVEINPLALQQVLVNLITNALDALESAERPRLTIESRREGDLARIRVADNGPGMPEHVLEHVFDPFFTTKPVGYGTGLGLSISYRLVETMGGEIWAESRPGHGAAFTIDIPLARAQRDSSPRDEVDGPILGTESRSHASSP